MIIQSLLDTDLYKFTMMQVVLHHFPGAQVEYEFRCRTEGVDLQPHLEEIRAEVRRRLQAKIDLVRKVEPQLDFKISDFGTRRRFSLAWRDEIIATLKREVPECFAGTSNVWHAMRHDTTPLGTMAHEYMQACQALGPRLRDSQSFAFDMWAKEYRGDL